MQAWIAGVIAATWDQTLLILGIYAGGLLLERLFPAGPHAHWKTIGFNVLYVPVYLFIITITMPALNGALGAWLETWGRWVSIELPQSPWGLVATALCYMIVFDFFYYAFHRLQHSYPWLWETHRLHHSDEAMSVTTTARVHWLESPFRLILMTLPMGLVFDVEVPSVAWLSTPLLLWTFFVHLNVRLQLGWLTPLMVGPQLHRIHHSREPQHHNRNFCLYTPLWDILFGSYYAPVRNEFPRTGLEDGENLSRLGPALWSPFTRWRAAWRARKARAGAICASNTALVRLPPDTDHPGSDIRT